MRYQFLFICFISCIFSASAQVRFGIEVGSNVSHAFETSNSKVGFNVGVTGEYVFTKHWLIDASLKLSSQPCGDKIQIGFENNVEKYDVINTSYSPYYLTLPIRAGYRLQLATNTNLTIAVGPMVGLGLFGKSHEVYNSVFSSLSSETGSNNIFDAKQNDYFSSSRFEYGIDSKLALEFKRHYTLGLNYSVVHIAGKQTAIDNMGIFSINIGYKF